ncbi:MAG TPA: hypothetical protein VJJ21_02585 [Candidatus Nanoarchaeia archaeon]|nr:hypothetical protein [Candidatus Nanoarchaeia archaeon]
MNINGFVMITSAVNIVLGVVCFVYVFGIAKLTDGKFSNSWKIFMGASVFFILAKIFRGLAAFDVYKINPLYAESMSIGFILLLTWGLLSFNKCVKEVFYKKNHLRKKNFLEKTKLLKELFSLRKKKPRKKERLNELRKENS